MKKEDLQKIIDDDSLGLLTVKSKNSSLISADERLASSFEEITRFVEENNREPKEGQGIQEHKLLTRLKSIREDGKKIDVLKSIDRYSLLGVVKKEISSINDIFEDDILEILDEGEKTLFDIRNISQEKRRSDADFVARRKPCKDFSKFENLFKECQKDLTSGRRRLIPFVESEMSEGNFFVLNGILFLLSKIGKPYRGNSGKINRRTYCLFENGTESTPLLRSLGKKLSENGSAVSERLDTFEGTLLSGAGIINDGDRQRGFIYILRSLSKDPKIRSIKDLYKLGYSKVPVEERIKNAKEESTYLMAPVRIISTFECYNFNPQKLEQLLHNFFGSACLNVDIFDKKGQRHIPREWFIARLEIIEKAVDLIISGGIVNYKYDSDQEDIVLR